MTKKYTFIIFLLLSISFPQFTIAEIRLPAIIASNMVLQRNATVKLWGWADAGEEIAVKVSWTDEFFYVKANADGDWMVEVTTTDSKAAQEIAFKSKESEIRLSDILFGEVWLCSGQSNMQQPLKGYKGEPVFGAQEALTKSTNPNLRLFSVQKKGTRHPLQDVEGYTPWQQASPGAVAEFSAVAWFFGQQLQEFLDCPVGLIHSSYGGSSVEAWISAEVLGSYQTIDIENLDITDSPQNTPTALYNAMLAPLIPFTIKGALWYQGESNRLAPEKYKTLFPAMVSDWRERWDMGEFPFYYVQIAPFLYNGDNEVFQDDKNSAFIRESQLKCLELIPNSGIAIALDAGAAYSIHPPEKKKVADRLLYNALHKTYGFSAFDADAPVYEAMEVKDGGIVLTFKNAETGLFAFGELKDFEIAGEDKVFYKAKATIVNRNRVFVKSESVAEPLAVRYAWKNWVEGSLFDTNLLPASSFRTDQWKEATRAEE